MNVLSLNQLSNNNITYKNGGAINATIFFKT